MANNDVTINMIGCSDKIGQGLSDSQLKTASIAPFYVVVVVVWFMLSFTVLLKQIFRGILQAQGSYVTHVLH